MLVPVARGGQRQTKHAAGVGRVDDAVVPQPRRREFRLSLLVVPKQDAFTYLVEPTHQDAAR